MPRLHEAYLHAPRRPPRPPANWTREVERFLAQKSSESGVGDAWLRRLRWELDRLPYLLDRVGFSAPLRTPRDIQADAIVALRKGLRWEKATFALHFSALRQFTRWAGNPIADRAVVWRLPTGQTSRRRWISKDQLARLLSAARGDERILVTLEGLNGLRRIEVLRLRRRDLLFDEGCLQVLGKGRNGGKWREIPMHPAVRAVLAERSFPGTPEDRIIPLSTSGADALLQRAVTRSGLALEGVRVSHHDLRRTFGRLAHEAGMDLVQLKYLLGHASVDMTVHYIGLDSERMRRGLELIHL